MDKYQKMLMGILIGAVSIALISVFIGLSGFGTGGTGSDESGFPFYIFLPGWLAIFIPLIARQRKEAKEENRSRKQLDG
ncbi:MAG: hypothetical protein ACFFKA_01800 [Candidatus Thorarchaeota archaeon]